MSGSRKTGDKTVTRRGEFYDYWLVVLDYNQANEKVSVTNAAAENDNDNSFSVYPVPAKDVLRVRNQGKATYIN